MKQDDKFILIRYGIAGGINTVAGFVTYCAAIIFFSAPFWLANFAAMMAGIICGFCLANIFVFKGHDAKLFSSAWRYILTLLSQFTISTLTIGILVSRGVSEIISYILVLPIVIVLSYFLQRTWVFKSPKATL